MSMEAKQILIIASLGLLVVLAVIRLARRGQLSFRYAMGWLTVGGSAVVAGLLVPLTEQLSEIVEMTPAALVGLASLVFIMVIAIQLSVSISGLQRQVRSLTEELARLDLKMKERSSDVAPKESFRPWT